MPEQYYLYVKTSFNELIIIISGLDIAGKTANEYEDKSIKLIKTETPRNKD